MHPCALVLDYGARLSLDEFATEFRRAWSGLQERFLKLECWQAYQEQPHNRSQQAFQRGEIERARSLLREEAETNSRRLYQDIRERKLDYTRIRLVKEPLTEYLAYEMMSYQIRADMGESIAVLRIDRDVQLPNAEFFDFLLFDRRIALVHDYGRGDVGVQTGGWLVRNVETLATLERTALTARRRSVPLHMYISAGNDRGAY